MKSSELKKIHKEIGDSIHAMNTIAVSLSIMPESVIVPKDLRVSWAPKNVNFSKYLSRSYSERSAIVYSVESLFEYIKNISRNPLWSNKDINFDGKESKPEKTYRFLSKIPDMDQYISILTELVCRWRNKIVHLNATKSISKKKIDYLLENKDFIYKNLHHFDVSIALDNFDSRKFTLKDASTLITIALKSAEIIDNYFIIEANKIEPSELKTLFLENNAFKRILNQSDKKRSLKQMKTWISTYYPYLDVSIDDLM